jgi:uncharacterized protein RhaS with RHS repeats
VLRYFEQVKDAEKSRLPRQLWSDVRESDGVDGVHLDLALIQTVAASHCDARAYPESHAARDLSATDSFAKTLGEHHAESLDWAATAWGTLPPQPRRKFRYVSIWGVRCGYTAHKYSYDGEGKLISSNFGSTTYTYDAEGDRIAKSNSGGVSNLYFYDVAGQKLADSDGAPLKVLTPGVSI